MPPVLSLDTKCPECANGATGLIGHKYLVVFRTELARADDMRFRCSLCAVVWRRKHRADSGFSWHRDEDGDAPNAVLAAAPAFGMVDE